MDKICRGILNKENISSIAICPFGYYHNGFIADCTLTTQDVGFSTLCAPSAKVAEEGGRASCIKIKKKKRQIKFGYFV